MTTIQQPVGEGARTPNSPGDVTAIQELLNRIQAAWGGPSPRLEVNGRCESPTIVAIKKFQWRQIVPPSGARHAADGRIEPNRGTLRRLDELAAGTAPPNAPPPGVQGMDVPLPFLRMWGIIQSRHTREVGVFPPELLIGLFWEETNFRNVPGRVPTMLGFGQVWSGNIERLNEQFGTNFSPSRVTGTSFFGESVELVSTALAAAYRARHGRESALHYYATGRRDRQNPLVYRWLRCMTRLQDLQLRLGAGSVISDGLGVAIREALWQARGNVFSPDLAFP